MQYEVKKKNIYEYVEWEGGKLINWQINTLSKINYKMAGGGRGKAGAARGNICRATIVVMKAICRKAIRQRYYTKGKEGMKARIV